MKNRYIKDFWVNPERNSSALYEIFCLCNDGTLWVHSVGASKPWRQLEDVPQPSEHDIPVDRENI